MKYQILQGDNRQTLKTIPDNSIDAIVTDPPYGIDFLGKAWDANTGALETYQECLRVLKPGGHILAFSAARTYHHLAITLEQAGFEIRDQIMWIYSSGFPKSQDVGKSIERSEGKRSSKKKDVTDVRPDYSQGPKGYCNKCNVAINTREVNKCSKEGCPYEESKKPAQNEWAGWGTALKPAHEPIALARKPIKLSIAKNAQKWGTGALNIDATRVPYDDPKEAEADAKWRAKYSHNNTGGPTFSEDNIHEQRKKKSNKPSKTTMSKTTHANLNAEKNADSGFDTAVNETWEPSNIGRFPSNVLGEISEPYQKYFYCPKVSRRERHIGFDITKVPVIEFNDPGKIKEHPLWDASIGTNVQRLKEKIRLHNESCITPLFGNVQGAYDPATGERFAVGLDAAKLPGNNHPTVKPIELMKYLIKLVTPPGGIVLDPFNGSGSTGCAAVELGHEYIGCELDPAYVEIAKTRIEAWNKADTSFGELFE